MGAEEKIPMCNNCKRGRIIPITNDIICYVNGVVSQNYLCKKYDYDFLSKKPKRKRELNTGQFSAADFSIKD